ncbi:TPA: hypothetical protein I7774_18970 [Vibrio vulnificus]|nr:hypothetical protein [Vibrio vulnificus]
MGSVCIAFLILVNPFLFGRVFWGSDVITLFFILLSASYLLKKKTCFSLKISPIKLFLLSLVSLYYISTTIIRLSVSQGFGDLSLHFYQYLSILILLALRVDHRNLDMFYKGICIALVWHVWTIIPQLPLNGFLSSKLSSLTAYTLGEYSIGGLSRRATGFFTAPGYLSLFASSSFACGVLMCMSKINKLNMSILALSCIAGFGSFSRTFMVIFILIAIYIFVVSKFKHKVLYGAILLLLGGYFTSTTIFKDYFGFVGERLTQSTDFSSNDRIAGETGVLMALDAIIQEPFTGSAISPDGGDIKASVDGKIIRPHFGILAIISFYGIVVSLTLILPMLFALFKSFALLISSDDVEKPVMAAFLAAFLVCIAEPLIDTNLIVVFMVYSLLLSSKFYKNRSFSSDFNH